MTSFGKLPLAGLGIVAGGLLLGTALAGFANPSPKAAPAPPWAGQVEPPVTAAAPITYVSYPQDLNPPNLVDGYAPAIAFTQMRAPVDPPLPKLEASWDKRWKDRWADADLPREPGPAPQADEDAADPQVPHYAALERSAAPQPGADASAPADAGADPGPLPAGETKVIHIADAGD